MAKSGFVIFVPEAESLVGALRAEYDESARLGAPAHITVLFPFMEPANINEEVIRVCTRVLAAQSSFSFMLAAVGRFPETAYLEPSPSEPFVALTNALVFEFPAYQPYGGEFSSIVPHLTVAHGSATQAALAGTALLADLTAHGSVSSRCSSVVLLENSSAIWRPMHVFSLAPATGV